MIFEKSGGGPLRRGGLKPGHRTPSAGLSGLVSGLRAAPRAVREAGGEPLRRGGLKPGHRTPSAGLSGLVSGLRAAPRAGLAVLASLAPGLSAAEGLRPIRGPIVPGFWEEHGQWAVPALVVALVAATALALWIRKRLRRPKPPSPLALYREETREVRALLERNETAEVPARLSRVLREYIEASTGVRAPEQTTEEFLAMAGRPAGDGDAAQVSETALPPEAVEELRPFLALADEAKFARRALGGEECRELLSLADRFVAANEERMSAR